MDLISAWLHKMKLLGEFLVLIWICPAVWWQKIYRSQHLFPFFSNHSKGRECGHFPWLRILLLRSLPEPHPEQQWWDYTLFQDMAAQRPYPSHRQVSWLRQPGAEGRRCLPCYQPWLWSLWSYCGASQWEVQWQLVAWRESDPQPSTGKTRYCVYYVL